MMESKAIAWKIHIVQPPNSSADPSPNADATKAKIGKQHGENNAVKKSPTVPNLSILLVSLMVAILSFSLRVTEIFYVFANVKNTKNSGEALVDLRYNKAQ